MIGGPRRGGCAAAGATIEGNSIGAAVAKIAGGTGEGRRPPRPGQPARRRSSDRGDSLAGSTRGAGIGPGVWPKGWNRARRRASASLALTGSVS